MQTFDLEFLLAPGLVIFFATWWLAFKVTRSGVFSLSAGIVKAGAFLFYFGMLFDGTFTVLDDWEYLEGGWELYAQNVGLANLVENWEFALLVGGGEHIVYYLYNAYAFRVFGEGYFAPVALNILITLPIAWFGTCLAAREFGFFGDWKKLFFAFLLFHPDIFVWSNVMNGKDILVLFLHVLLLLSASMFFQERWRLALALAIPVSLILFFLRFYVPALFSAALVASLVLRRRHREVWPLLIVGSGLAMLAWGWLGEAGLEFALAELRENFVNPLYGFARFTLTPIPFNTDIAYSFLDIPALIHWILMPFMVWGVVLMLRQKTPFAWFFLFYVLVFAGLYAVYGGLQGPRHRVQLDFAWAVLQFMGLQPFLRLLFHCLGSAQPAPTHALRSSVS
jgi:hypothetical protein